MGINELQRDPYEVKTVEVKQSRIEGAEEGLFTKRDVVSGKSIDQSNKHAKLLFTLLSSALDLYFA